MVAVAAGFLVPDGEGEACFGEAVGLIDAEADADGLASKLGLGNTDGSTDATGEGEAS